MRQRDLARLGLAVTGDEQKVARQPSLVAATLGAALDGQAIEHAAQHDDGELPLVEIHKKDAPGLACDQRAQLFDGFDGHRMLGLEVEFLRLPVVYGVFPVVYVHRPAQFIVQVGH